jgi:hypothetical protein
MNLKEKANPVVSTVAYPCINYSTPVISLYAASRKAFVSFGGGKFAEKDVATMFGCETHLRPILCASVTAGARAKPARAASACGYEIYVQ